MARLYSNENFPLPVVEELRRLGHEVVTVQSTIAPGTVMTDQEVLEFATPERLAVLTLNRRHFVRLHLEHPEHAGIIVCTFDLRFTAQARRIHDAITAHPDLSGELIRVNRPPA